MGVWLIPGTRENGIRTDFSWPYQEPLQVPLAEKAKAYWEKLAQGTRQIGRVSSVEPVPTLLAQLGVVGRSDKGGPTVYSLTQV